jgi:hypothetical protein
MIFAQRRKRERKGVGLVGCESSEGGGRRERIKQKEAVSELDAQKHP